MQEMAIGSCNMLHCVGDAGHLVETAEQPEVFASHCSMQQVGILEELFRLAHHTVKSQFVEYTGFESSTHL